MKRREKNTLELTSHQTISLIGARMKCLHLCGLLATLPILAGPKIALAQSTPAVELSSSELHQFHADDGTLYQIYVAFPLGYEPNGDARYPVLYMTDPSGFFALVAQTMRLMELDEELPPMILVGFDKPVSSLPEALMRRYFDLTPTHDPKREKDLLESFGREVPTGGADALLAALKDEIIPWVEERYPASAERGLLGYSLGGLFATHALLTTPGSFTHYLLGSPSLYWNDEVMFERERAYSSKHQDLPARVFLSVGTNEGAEHIGRVLRFAEALQSRKYPGLELERHIFLDQTHSAGIGATMSRGLMSLFGGH